MLIPLKSTSSVLDMISNVFVPICNRSYDRQANSDKKPLFRGVLLFGTPVHRPLCSQRSGLGLLKSTFNAKKIRLQVILVYLMPF